MKPILLITPYTPDNQGVGVSYTSQLIKELSKTCFVDVAYFRYKEDKPYSTINDNVHVVIEKVIDGKNKLVSILRHPFLFPLFSVRYDKDFLSRLQKQVAEVRYDFIYFDFSQTFIYAKYINHPNKILMAHDVIAQKYSRMKTYLRPWAVASERKILQYGTIIFTFSNKDCGLLRSLYGVKSLSTTFFLNQNVIEAEPDKESEYFVFFGAWDRFENEEALTWFLDKVYNDLPQTIAFKVIGGGMKDGLKNRIKELPNIEYLGFVDNPYPIIANAKAEIAPLHMGAGVKVKCVEAMGCGTSVIGTEVAFEGIGEEYSSMMHMANTPQEYKEIISTYQSPLEEKKKAKAFFISHYNDKKVLKYIKEDYKQ